ncbi:cysteine desulfurase [Patescibacteria group bacterium]|nr:cysteine desulfurase [Patescibacteria group bacterium]
MKSKQNIYLDNSASTKMLENVVNAMLPYLYDEFANPSSTHTLGQRSRIAIDNAREIIANYLNSEIQEIIFTSGGTESNNIAIQGVAKALKSKGRHIIVSKIEHDSILKCVQMLEDFDITYLPVDKNGFVSPKSLKKAIRKDTILISIMHANSEIGTIQDIRKFADIAHEGNILFHTDAIQSIKYLDINVVDLGVDLLSFGSHKIYGPKGIGGLYIKRSTPIVPLFPGSSEYGVRGGTENVAGIVGFGKAIEILSRQRNERYKKVKILRDFFEKEIIETMKGIEINGNTSQKLPHITNIYFPNIDTESMLINLDMHGIYASAGSACSSLSIEPSHVLKAIGLSSSEIKHSVRFSLSEMNTRDELIKTIDIIKNIHG